MKTWAWYGVVIGMAAAACAPAFSQDAAGPFLGCWALTLPANGPGWLDVRNDGGYLDGGLLWYGGSVNPVSSMYVDGSTLCATMTRNVERKDAAGKVVRTQEFTETLVLTVSGDTISGVRLSPKANGSGVDKVNITGKRIPPAPPAPDLNALKFGKSIQLFKGKNLKGWRLTNPAAISGWSVEKGVLINNPVQEEGKPHKSYGNLRTDAEFEDFNLTLETSVPPGGNSGIYLRGIYEVQVCDTFGKEPEAHSMGSIYSRIAPTAAAEKAPNEWQTFDITLADRHVTVKLNGKTVIDNQPLLGCTGGALTSDEFKPGPIYLQGDHTGIKYRNIVLRPIVKK